MKFNIIVAGYGGQGVITLTEIISKCFLKEGYDVKQAELHGLAQRGGSLQAHIKVGEKVHTSLVRRGDADLIIALESLEALRACYWANDKTKLLTNSKVFVLFSKKKIKLEDNLKEIKKFVDTLEVVDADEIVGKIGAETMMVNIFMLGYAIAKKFLPIKKEVAWKVIEERFNKRFLDLNRKVFEEGFKSG
jgi:indolepyruvate ferredoxin oxidoreductase beta subunit